MEINGKEYGQIVITRKGEVKDALRSDDRTVCLKSNKGQVIAVINDSDAVIIHNDFDITFEDKIEIDGVSEYVSCNEVQNRLDKKIDELIEYVENFKNMGYSEFVINSFKDYIIQGIKEGKE